jgi:hypothetical protein
MPAFVEVAFTVGGAYMSFFITQVSWAVIHTAIVHPTLNNNQPFHVERVTRHGMV